MEDYYFQLCIYLTCLVYSIIFPPGENLSLKFKFNFLAPGDLYILDLAFKMPDAASPWVGYMHMFAGPIFATSLNCRDFLFHIVFIWGDLCCIQTLHGMLKKVRGTDKSD